MVQPPLPTMANGRPDYASCRPAPKVITTGKYEGFSAYLQKLSGRTAAPQAGPCESEIPERLSPVSKRELSAEPELSRSLAPEEQPSLGGGGADPAEWLSLINPLAGLEGVTTPAAVVAPAAATHSGVAQVAELVERWVRRVALGGDQRRGAVRLDIGQGRFSGTELLVVAEAGHVSVELQLPASMPEGDLSERLRARLERRGFAADVVVR